jgi:isocitrate dehydrogenase
MLLEHFGLHEEAQKVHEAVLKSIEYNVVTIDLNPKLWYKRSWRIRFELHFK